MHPSEQTSVLGDRLIELFTRIERERMQDVPILNEALSVDAFGFDGFSENGYSIGILLTPWFMNLVLMPQDASLLDGCRVGQKLMHLLPVGQFEFIVNHEPETGSYLSCSLFSPMFQFADQVAAVDTARAVLDQVFTEPDSEETACEAEEEMSAIWRGKIPCEAEQADGGDDDTARLSSPSRRDLLRGFRPDTHKTDAFNDREIAS